MAILVTDGTESRTGFKKKIDSNSEEVILNIVQVSLYQYPFKSMIREIVSNAVDSNKEKNVARLIKTGAAKEEDYFVVSDSDLYKDSKFDPDYYDLKWLSPSDAVTITYEVNPDYQGRDLLSIKDNGVGLGGYRLEKFFSPGASTKRLNKHSLGKYGIGSKSPLSTGIGVYRLISFYEGKHFIFDIYEDKTDSIVPKFNEDGTENKYIEFQDTEDMRGNKFRAYYYDTEEQNSVNIQVEVRKHNKNQIIEAVKSQLMYFEEDIHFVEYQEDSYNIEHSFKTPILHEDEDLIVPLNSSYYNRPHFILNRVCYGLINFQELDLNTKYGNIGIKVDPSEIDVNPSRESVAYTQKTKNTIISKYQGIVDRVTTLIDKELQVEDPLLWLRKVNSIILHGSNSNNSSDNVLLSRLSNLIDKSEVKPVYTKNDLNFKYEQDLRSMTSNLLNITNVHVSGYSSNRTVRRENATNSLVFDRPVYIQFNNASSQKTAYVLRQNNESYTNIRFSTDMDVKVRDAVEDYFRGRITKEDLLKQEVPKEVINNFKRAINFLEFLKGSSEVHVYDDVVVPDDFSVREDDDTYEVSAAEKARIRKQAGLFNYGKLSRSGNGFTFSQRTSSLEDFKENIWYGHQKDRASTINVATALSFDNGQRDYYNNNYGTTSDTEVIQIAVNVAKEFPEGRHVDEFGYDIDNNGKFIVTSKTMVTNARYKIFKELYPDIMKDSGIISNFLYLIRDKVSYYEGFNKLISSSRYEYQVYLPDVVKCACDAEVEFIQRRKEDLSEDDVRDVILRNFNYSEFSDYVDEVGLITEEEKDLLEKIGDLWHWYSSISKELLRLTEHTSTGDLNNMTKYLDLILSKNKDYLQFDHEELFKI